MIAPVLEQIAKEKADIIIGKINVDENSQTATKFGIRGIPTLMLFKNGEAIGTQVGALSKNDLEKFITDNI